MTEHTSLRARFAEESRMCTTCRCTGPGVRGCRRGEGFDIGRMPGPMLASGKMPRPYQATPPNQVPQALAHFRRYLTSDDEEKNP